MITTVNPEYSFARDGVTQSLFSEYMACPRSFAIMTHGYGTPSKYVMELGSYGHKCIEMGTSDIMYKFPKEITTEQAEQIKAIMHAVIPVYLKRYSRKGIENEKIIDVKLVSGVRVRGKVDGIDSIYIYERKFKSRIGEEDIGKSLGFDWQTLFYLLFTDRLQVVYDVIRYPQFSKKSPDVIYKDVAEEIKKEPERWFYRWKTTFTQQDMDEFTIELLQKFKEMTTRTLWYRNQCACRRGYGLCPFIEYCETGSVRTLYKKPLFSELKRS